LATKKYVLIRVISQIKAINARPIPQYLHEETKDFPTAVAAPTAQATVGGECTTGRLVKCKLVIQEIATNDSFRRSVQQSHYKECCEMQRDQSRTRSVVSSTQTKSMMILIAGPYRSRTNDDPVLIQRNIETMESYALPIFRAGHIPLLGEWLALPLVNLAGSKNIGDEAFNEIFHPIAVRLLEKCDAVLRVGGPSAGADEMVRVGRERGLKIYTDPAEIPKSN
jgi:hypothetical protein